MDEPYLFEMEKLENNENKGKISVSESFMYGRKTPDSFPNDMYLYTMDENLLVHRLIRGRKAEI